MTVEFKYVSVFLYLVRIKSGNEAAMRQYLYINHLEMGMEWKLSGGKLLQGKQLLHSLWFSFSNYRSFKEDIDGNYTDQQRESTVSQIEKESVGLMQIMKKGVFRDLILDLLYCK